ncbi:trophoblast glycoprotein-like [Pleurodeles waltl]|uniref:trophoblast glycoprotein-like n=1 Tax=Pleurodeles waltl TaxID=8319 RepID=UPI0037093B54
MGEKQSDYIGEVKGLWDVSASSFLLACGIICAVLMLLPGTGACPEDCHCYEDTGAVHCRSPDIPDSLPPWVRNLTVTKGNISTLRTGAFANNGTTLVNLTALTLTDNGIEVIEALAFQGLPSLAVLDLSHNALTSVASGALWGLGQLHTLRMNSALRQGALEQLSAELLNRSFVALAELELSDNQLQALPAGVLKLGELRTLNLRHNSLQSLDAPTLAGLHRHRRLQLSLSANPFLCDCQLKPLLLWLRNSSQVRDSAELRCSAPARMNGSFIVRLKAEELKCINEDLETASYVFFGIVLALIGVLFLMVLYLNRRGIKKWLNNFREACRDQMEGYHYRYEQDADPRRVSATGGRGL